MSNIRDFIEVLEYSFEKLIELAKNENHVSINAHIKKAQKKDDKAFFYIGRVYYRFKKYYKAMAWFLMSSKRGNSKAQRTLGVIYQEGFGVNKDNTLALVWFTRSALHGYTKAYRNIKHLSTKGYRLSTMEIDLIKMEQSIITIVHENDERMNQLEKENIDLKAKLQSTVETVQGLSEKIKRLENEFSDWSIDDGEEVNTNTEEDAGNMS